MDCRPLIMVLLLSSMYPLHAETHAMKHDAELKIALDTNAYRQKQQLLITGSYRTWVNCGSQLAIWVQFPREIGFQILDLGSGQTFASVSAPMSVSYAASTIEEFHNMPCDQMVEQPFSVDLAELYLRPPAAKEPMKISAQFLGTRSNVLLIPE